MQHPAQDRLAHQMLHHPEQPKCFKHTAQRKTMVTGVAKMVPGGFLLAPSKSLKYKPGLLHCRQILYQLSYEGRFRNDLNIQRSLAGYSPWGCKELDTTW